MLLQKINALNLNKAVIIIISGFVFFNYLLRFDGPVKGYWDTYITVPALFITNTPVTFTSKEGEKLYSYSLPGKLPENLVDNKTYGISPKDQRLGTAIFFAPWFLIFNAFGFRLLFALSGVMIFLFSLLTIRLFTKNPAVYIFSASLAALNYYILSINNLNPNIIGMLFISVLLYLLIIENPNGFIIGLIYGVLGGIRNESILFLPAIIYKLSTSSNNKATRILFFILGAFITISPILYWNNYAFGNPFMHPTQFPALGGFRPEFEHRFLFWKFNFNGMLNYPFYHKIIRTPYFSFPTFLLLPLTLISSFGIILFVLIFTGAICLFKKFRREFIFFALWFTPMYLLLSVQENWSELKMTFILLVFNPLILCLSLGLDNIFANQNNSKNIFKIASFSIIIFLITKLLFYSNFEVDLRWYTRFPRAIKGVNISFIGDDLRTKKEDPLALLIQKKILTQGNFLPRFCKNEIDIPNKLKKIKEELLQTDITTIDFWKYIYEK